MIDIIIDTLVDGFKILPFLWVAFFLIEFIEHKYSRQTQKIIEKSGKFGPLLGGVLGCFPQCGFSVAATNLYVTRIITLGTLISVYLSTSDEMLPILLAHGSNFQMIFKLIGTKLVIGVFWGFVIDFIYGKRIQPRPHEFCESEHCHCEEGIFLSSLKHTIHTLIFILGVSFLINLVMEFFGADYLRQLFQMNHFFVPFLASLIGLIPNCGASIVLTELYLNQVISFSAVISGLLTGSGVALLVLFQSNKDFKENFKILLLVYFIGVFSGILFNFIPYFN